MTHFTSYDRKLLGAVGVSAEPAPDSTEALGRAREDVAIACALYREADNDSRRWKRIAFAWCTTAVVAAALAITGWTAVFLIEAAQ